MKAIIFIIINLLLSIQSFSQKYEYISFYYDHSLMPKKIQIKAFLLQKDYMIDINYFEILNDNDTIILKDTTFTIKKITFDSLKEKFFQISPLSLKKVIEIGSSNDGGVFTITYGEIISKISYCVWEIDSKEYKLEEFNSLIKYIFKICNLKYSKIVY